MVQKRRGPRPKHVPQRTCIACRQVAGKRGLVRLVRTAEGVVVDVTGKQAGRGAYLHVSRNCWMVALRGNRIEQALRTRLDEASRAALMAYMQELPDLPAAEDPLEEAGD
jgi:predicted RNA-binding protein YlxR (DUF448 family)